MSIEQTDTGATITIDSAEVITPEQKTEPTKTEIDLQSLIPEQYKDKEYFKNMKSTDELFNQFVNAQSLIGKRPAGIPSKDSKPEEWDKFYQAWGRPESFDKYDFGEGVEVTDAVKEMFYKNGLNADQAKNLYESFMSQVETQKAQNEEQINKEFDEMSVSIFGSKENADKAINDAREVMIKELDPSTIEEIKNLPNNQLLTLAKVLSKVKNDYMAEGDTITTNNRGALSKSDILAEARTVYSEMEKLSPMDPQKDALFNKWKDLISKAN